MTSLYMIANISRQGHFDAVKRAVEQLAKAPCYIGLMNQIREIHPGMGLRKMYDQFQPDGIGRDAFISLGLSYGFRLATLVKPHRTTYSIKSNRFSNLLEGMRFTDVNQLWVSDIFYFPFDEKHYYVTHIMDVYSRRIIGYCIADNMRAENNIAALRMALTLRGIKDYKGKLIHHSDRGGQYISDDYTNLLEEHKIKISMCTDVLENAHCERANGTIKNEYLKRYNIKTVTELFSKLNIVIMNYNNRRHNSIEMTPIEFENQLQTIPAEKRKVMTIFTISNQDRNPMQLELIFKNTIS